MESGETLSLEAFLEGNAIASRRINGPATFTVLLQNRKSKNLSFRA
jgi:hypothetical protein